MATHGMFFGWNRPIVGRERDAAEVFSSSMAFWNKKLQSGEIESFDPVLLGRHGGDLNGFVLVKGDHHKLHTIVNSDEFKELVLRIDHTVLGFGAIPAYVDQGTTDQMTAWMKLITR